LLDHCLHLTFVSDIAGDGNRLVTGSGEAICCCPNAGFIDVGQRYSSPFCSKCLRSGQTHARAGAGDECDFVFKFMRVLRRVCVFDPFSDFSLFTLNPE
jgi:hypothetical protein